MRQVVGKSTHDVDASAFAALRTGYTGLVLDVGTGDGKHALTVARARPDMLVVGLDAAPDAMRPTAASAARKPERGGVPNALFVWASAQQLPAELADVDDVHVLMPWGSLLRACIEPDVAVLRGIRAACAQSARFLITVNLHAWRPPVPEVGASAEPTPDSVWADLAPRYADAGWVIDDVARPDAARLAALGTSWTKRLGSTREDLAVLELSGHLT